MSPDVNLPHVGGRGTSSPSTQVAAVCAWWEVAGCRCSKGPAVSWECGCKSGRRRGMGTGTLDAEPLLQQDRYPSARSPLWQGWGHLARPKLLSGDSCSVPASRAAGEEVRSSRKGTSRWAEIWVAQKDGPYPGLLTSPRCTWSQRAGGQVSTCSGPLLSRMIKDERRHLPWSSPGLE